MHCTQCGARADGRFCSSCGASLQTIGCPGCRAQILPGTRFCTSCGAPARSASSSSSPGGAALAARGGGNLGWWVAGGLLVIILLAIAIDRFSASDSGSPGAMVTQGGGLGPTGAVDLSAMTPREAADRLFSRVMAAVEQGNDAEAMSFLPMAIDAYGLARPLDEDGLYHLALLQGASGDFAASLQTSMEGLEESPEHLLLLSTAADAARELGDTQTARIRYALLLDAWDREMALLRQEYTDHSRILPFLREDAEQFLSGESP